MASSPLTRLVEKHGIPRLDQHNLDRWLKQQTNAVLFFAGDPKRYPETSDVAVILPELIEHFRGRLQAALIDQEAEPSLQARYGFNTWPSLVVLRNGEYVGVISRVRNWGEYLRELQMLLAASPAPTAARRIPIVSAPAAPTEAV